MSQRTSRHYPDFWREHRRSGVKHECRWRRLWRHRKKYYDQKHRDIQFPIGDSVLLSTQNLQFKAILHKLQWKFCGPYKVLEKIGAQAYRLQLPDTWRAHPMFHVSLFKHWRPSIVQQVLGKVELDDVDAPQYFDVEKILWWRWSSKTRRRRHEFLVLW